MRVRTLTFEGVGAVDDSRLKEILQTREWPLFPWGEKRYFDRAALEADLKRIVDFYADRGYPDARVSSFDVRFSADRREVDVTVEISEGEPILVEELRLVGFDVVPTRQLDDLVEELPLASGDSRDRTLLLRSREIALYALGDRGYPYAQIRIVEQPGQSPSWTRLSLVAELGPLAFYGPIEIAGNFTVDDEVIRRQLAYRPGGLFRLSHLRESERRLNELELFETAKVEVTNEEGQPAEVLTHVTVVEADHRQLTFGGGYGTEGNLRANVNFRHINFLGGARIAGIEGTWSSIDRGVAVDFREPYLFHPLYSLQVSGEGQFVNEPTYEARRVGSSISVTRRLGPTWPVVSPTTASVSLSYTNSVVEFEATTPVVESDNPGELRDVGLDPRTGIGEGTLSAVAFDLRRNTAGNLLDATQGYAVSAHLEQAGWWLGGTFRYIELRSEGRHYLTLGDRTVLASRIRFGALHGRAGPDVDSRTGVPLFKRYFLGGSTSLRGWGRYEVSPISQSGVPLGGLTTLEASTELRLPVAPALSAVLFLDAGNVWDRSWHVELGRLRSSVGSGLRFVTPLGPVRLDVGYQLTPINGLLVDGEPESKRWRAHFSIGQAF